MLLKDRGRKMGENELLGDSKASVKKRKINLRERQKKWRWEVCKELDRNLVLVKEGKWERTS